jgi:hypothetical protein
MCFLEWIAATDSYNSEIIFRSITRLLKLGQPLVFKYRKEEPPVLFEFSIQNVTFRRDILYFGYRDERFGTTFRNTITSYSKKFLERYYPDKVSNNTRPHSKVIQRSVIDLPYGLGQKVYVSLLPPQVRIRAVRDKTL